MPISLSVSCGWSLQQPASRSSQVRQNSSAPTSRKMTADPSSADSNVQRLWFDWCHRKAESWAGPGFGTNGSVIKYSRRLLKTLGNWVFTRQKSTRVHVSVCHMSIGLHPSRFHFLKPRWTIHDKYFPPITPHCPYSPPSHPHFM